MSFGGTKTETKTEQKTDPWAPAQPALNSVLSGAQNWLAGANDRQFYPGQTFAAMSDPTKAGTAMLANGMPNTTASQGYYADALSGKFASAENPYFKGMTDNITQAVMPGVNATFSKSGMTGSDPHQYNLTSALSNAISPYAYQNYTHGLDMMQSAASEAPQLDANVAAQKLQAGQIQEGYTQKQIDQDMAKYAYEQNRPLQALQETSGLVNPIAGMGGTSSGTTTQQTKQSPLQTALGLGMMGASAYMTGGKSLIGGGAQMFGGSAPQSYAPPSYNPYQPWSFNNAQRYY